MIETIADMSESGGDLVTHGIDYLAALLLTDADADSLAGIWAGDWIVFGDWQVSFVPMLRLWLYRASDKRSVRITDVQRWGSETLSGTCEIYDVESLATGRRWRLSAGDAATYAEQSAATYGAIGRAIIDAFTRAGLPKYWRDGTGRVAGALLDRMSGREVLKANPYAIQGFVESAYFGGRISIARVGQFESVTQLDIRSAYPSAMVDLPSLAGSTWHRTHYYDRDRRLTIWFVEWKIPKGARAGPFPLRHGKQVSYPLHGCGWYWDTEVRAAVDVFGGSMIRPRHGFYLKLANDDKPFAGIKEHYARRQFLRDSGDRAAAHVLKLTLTSLYGRLAQSMTMSGLPGRWSSLPLAGLITGTVRGRMLEMFADHSEVAVSISTDSLTIEGNTDLIAGAKLGEWSVETGEDAILLPTGAFHVKHGAAAMDRISGVSRHASAGIDWNDVRAGWAVLGPALSYPVDVPYFVGIGLAANGKMPLFAQWRNQKRDIVGRPHTGDLRRENGGWRVLPDAGSGRQSDKYVPKAGGVSRRPDQSMIDVLTVLAEQATPE